MHKIILTSSEMYLAEVAATYRYDENLRNNAKPKDGQSWERVTKDNIMGLRGEMAVARFLDIYWRGAASGDYKADDLNGVEVRTTDYSGGNLILRPRDKLHMPYVLVICTGAVFDILGWIQARDGMQPKYLRETPGRPPAYFVPRSELKPMESLKQFL